MNTHQIRINALKLRGQQTITILDNEHTEWQSGFARFLMDNYLFDNFDGGFTAYLYSSRPEITAKQNITTFVANQEIEIYHASAITAGYGHKKIQVEILYNGEYKKFTATTSNMPAFDRANDLEGGEKYHAFYEIIERYILDEIAAWIEEINEAE